MLDQKDSNYFLQQKDKIVLKIREILSTLPYFCHEYFRGIENNTMPLTRLSYARDLKIFFNFLTSEILEFNSLTVKEIKIEHLNMLTATHLEIYLDYLTNLLLNLAKNQVRDI